MSQSSPTARRSETGVALAIVVWFIAGMALLVSGIVSDARMGTRMAQLHYFKAQAAAAGDGAINLALAEQMRRKSSGQGGGSRSTNYRVGDKEVVIRMIPAGLFVNLSSADAAMLNLMFASFASGVRRSPDQLARAVLDYRDGTQGTRGKAFYAIEDILRVPGVDRGVFDAVRDFIVVDALAGALRSESLSMEQRVAQLSVALDDDESLTSGFVEPAADKLRVDALVMMGDQYWLRRQWVSLAKSETSELPWRVMRKEAARPASIGRQR